MSKSSPDVKRASAADLKMRHSPVRERKRRSSLSGAQAFAEIPAEFKQENNSPVSLRQRFTDLLNDNIGLESYRVFLGKSAAVQE
jgi:hypothetical protein